MKQFRVLLLLSCIQLSFGNDQDDITLDIAMIQHGNNEETNDKSAFDLIAEVNPETANLMPENFDRNSDGLFEYDIMLHDWSHEKVFGRDPNRQYGASANFYRLWPDGKVYYTYHSSIASEAGGKTMRVIEDAMKIFERKTCITYHKRQSQEHYIEFHKGSGCWSMIGRIGGKQQISLGYGCEQVGVVVHEMNHALGFWHEQSRPDRDSHVEILFDNIKEGMKDQFKKYDNGEIASDGSPYDYLSVMHYGEYAFSKDRNNLKTIRVLDGTFTGTIGQRNDLSIHDVEQINKLYQCSVGIRAPVDGQWGGWSIWSTCDKTCGGGREIRSRTCNTPPPSNGGKTCTGSPIETNSCNNQGCPGPVECNFDQSFCLWKNGDGDAMNWLRTNLATTSGGTGPTADHTKGTSQGQYIYIEASSPAQKDDMAILKSSLLPFASYSRCFKFYYHMHGDDIGELNVYIRYGNAANLAWSLKGNQGNQWNYASVPIPSSLEDVQILVEGVRGNGYEGDIALDDFSMTLSHCMVNPSDAGEGTDPQTTTTTTTTTIRKPVTTIDPSLSCDFESTVQCSWGNTNSYDTMDWLINSGSTPSSLTGPDTGTTYLYLEGSSPAVEGDKAWILSPEISAVSATKPKCFQFDYHMYGDGIGELNIYFYDGLSTSLNKYWSIKGQQGKQWMKGQVEIPIGRRQRIIVEAIRGYTFTSDIAIDNLQVINSQCGIQPTQAQIRKTPTRPTTTGPTSPTANGVIKIEVVSEGCADPVVRQRTASSIQSSAKISGRRKKRSLFDWKEYFHKKAQKALNKGKTIIDKIKGKVTPRSKNGKFKEIIDRAKKRVISYLSKGMKNFKPFMKKLSTSTRSMASTEATAQMKNNCNLAKSSIKINGVEHSPLKPGHNVVAINGKTGTIIGSKWYDTKNNALAATSVSDDLQKLPDDTIIAIATQDSVLPQFVGETELQKIGAIPPYLPGAQGSWAFIGYKGKRNVNWITQSSQSKGNGPSRVSVDIPFLKGPVTGGGGTTTTTTTTTITTITILPNEIELKNFGYSTVPLTWSNKLDLGLVDYTVSLWFQTSQGGTLFSKVQQSLRRFEESIKTVFIEGGCLNIKLSRGTVYKILKNVADGKWHHVALTVKQARPSDILKVYIDGIETLSKLFQSVPDPTDTLVVIGKTVDEYPGESYFSGRMKKMFYKNVAINKKEVIELSKKP